ncbi:hypothetical protein HPB50_016473 [Hyalomma asiaticum]|uniref:Uncharacterized protein n=1 Tax=Hyalomma asiaticum TaxID=266040 RepID=A0ACB7RUW7_HYAAI|nr:hypothetical protein HPB50_016473 [Hyalomma asiaticum]
MRTSAQDTPTAEFRHSAPSEEESEKDARIRTAITVGVLTMVIVGLAAMAYSFNEAQRQLEYVQDSDHVKPSDLERAWRSAWNTTSTTVTDDLDMVSWSSSEHGEKKASSSTAKSKSDGDDTNKADVTPDGDETTEYKERHIE